MRLQSSGDSSTGHVHDRYTRAVLFEIFSYPARRHFGWLLLRLDEVHYAPYWTTYRGSLKRPMERIRALVTQEISVSHTT